MSAASVQLQIDALIQQRREAWSSGRSAGDVDSQLRELYDQLRVAKARERHGDRGHIVRRARIDRELEKLAEPQGG